MPDNDLGTAHGRVRITYEGKGAEQANASVQKMAAQFAAMQQRLAQVEKQLEKANKGLDTTSREMQKTSRSSSILSRDVLKTHRRFRSFRNEVGYLKDDLQGLGRLFNATGRHYRNFALVTRVFNQAGQYGGRQNLAVLRSLAIAMGDVATKTEGTARTVNGFMQNLLGWTGRSRDALAGTRASVSLLAQGYLSLRNRIFGVNTALNQAPAWVQNLNRVSTTFRKLAGAIGLVGIALGPFRLLERLAKTGLFDTLVKGIRGMSVATANLGNISKRVFGKDYFSGLTRGLIRSEGSMKRFLENSSSHFRKLSDNVDRTGASFLKFANDSKSLIGGVALVTTGIGNLWQRFQWFFKLPKPIMAAMAVLFSRVLPAALDKFGNALVGTSNILMGMLDGVKQLGGGLLTIPGLLAGIGAAVSALMPVFAGLGDKFKDLFSSDPTERWEALGKLPKHLQSLGIEIANLYPRWEKLQEALQTTAFRGVEKQIKSLADTYMPLFEKGANGVVQAFVHAKNQLVAFAEEGQTQKDFSKVYENVSVAIYNISTAIRPALAGMRDLITVGTDFWSGQSILLERYMRRFQEWARMNRENGRLMEWMVDAKQGMVDLIRGTRDATQAVWKMLTLFRDDSGENGLERFAEAMERFEAGVRKSAAVGFLSRLREGVRGIADANMDDIQTMFARIGTALERAWPFFRSISDSFSDIFIPAIENAAKWIGLFLKLVNELSISPVIGWILGFVGAVRLLPKVYSAAIDALKVFGGAFLVMANKDKVFTAIDKAVYMLGSRMQGMRGPLGTLGNGLVNVGNAGGKVMRIISGLVSAITILGTSAALFGVSIYQGNQQINAFSNALSDAETNTAKFKVALHDAFLSDRGLVGSTVLDTLSQRVESFMTELQTLQEATPGLTSHIGDFFEDLGGAFADWRSYVAPWTRDDPSESLVLDDEVINKYQVLGDNAKWARQGLTQLMQEGVDLTAVIRSSDSDFKALTDSIRASGDGGNETAAALETLRAEFKEAEAAARELGPAGASAAEGIKKIADAGGDASKKLDGLRQVMVALGLIQIDALEAASNYADAITTLSEKVAEAVANGDGLNGVFTEQGKLNVENSKTARNLLPIFKSLNDAFLAYASNGGDVDDMLARVNEQVAGLSQQLGIEEKVLRDFLTNTVGLTPDPVKILIQLEGKTDIEKAFGTLLAHLQSFAQTGVFVPITFAGKSGQEITDMQTELEKIIGRDVLDVHGTNIVLKPGIVPPSPEEIGKINEWLRQHGFTVPGMPPPANGPQVTPQAPPPGAPGAPGAGTPPAPITPEQQQQLADYNAKLKEQQTLLESLKQQKAGYDDNVKTPALDANIAKTEEEIKRIQDLINGINQTPVAPPPAPAANPVDQYKKQLEDAEKQIDDLRNKVSELSDKELLIKVSIEGKEAFDDLYQKITSIVTLANTVSAELYNAFKMTFDQLQQQALPGFIGGLEAGGRDAGEKFVAALAAGIDARNPGNIAVRAAEDLALEIRNRFHKSPPKKGPLSVHGDAAKWAGKKFSETYAQGIAEGTGGTEGAAGRLAASALRGVGQARGGHGQGMYDAGAFLGQISSLVGFIANAVDAFGKLATVILDTARFASDPLGKGTFFGKRKRFVRDPSISDEELQQRREDEAQRRMMQFYGSGQRPDIYDPKTGRIRGNEPGKLVPGAGEQDIANYIIQRAMSLGYSREQANQFVVQAVGESGLSPTATSSNGLWKGIFQFDSPTWEGAGGGDINDPQKNIDNYFALAAQRGLTPETFTDPHQLGTQVSIGGPLNPKNVGHEATARAAAQKYIDNFQEGVGQTVDGIAAGVPAAIANAGSSQKLVTDPGLEPAAVALAAVLEAQFPGITQIGGKQPRSGPQMHPMGRALDVGIGSDLQLGDAINAFVQANAAQFGVQSTIWRNKGLNLVANEGGGPGTTYDSEGHFDHVHIQFADGTTADVNPDGTMNFQVPANSPYAKFDYGLPPTPEEIEADKGRAPTKLVTRNPDGTFSEVHAGTGTPPGDSKINPATGRPWTPEEAAEFWNRPENALQYDASRLKEGDLQIPGVFQGTEEQMMEALKGNNPDLARAIATAQDENASDDQVADALTTLQDEAQRQRDTETAQGRAQADALEGIVSSAASDRGLAEEQTPIDKATEIAGAATSIAGDVFAVLNSTIEAIGATKNITSTLVRGVQNTEDIFNMIDDIQKYIQLGADIAGAVSSITGTIGDLAGAAGGMDMGASGAISAIGQIAGLIQAALETTNAMIDLGQEAYRIIGSYIGDFLGILTGGAGGALEGQVRFLLDETTNQLLAYSQDNPLDKRAHDLAWQQGNPDARNQLIGNINMYGGPGSDPRDMTRQMMFQVKASTYGQATGQ